ncbi:MAG TPA: VCBS repeat-containing protein, partial [Phenylobacterium sp.]
MKAFVMGAAALSLLGGAAQATVFVGGETGGVVTPYSTPGLSAGGAVTPYPGYAGGVRVAVGDVNGDGVADLVTGTSSGGPVIKVFDGKTGAEVRAFNAFAPSFTGGVRVAVGDLNGDGAADIVVGAGEGSAVRVFDGLTLDTLHSFNAFDAGFTGGVSVAVGQDDDGRAALIVGAGAGGAPVVNIYDP